MADSGSLPSNDGSAASGAAAIPAPRRVPAFVLAILGTLIFLGLTYIYRRYSLTIPANSDASDDLLSGYAVQQGNLILRHWVMTTVSWYTTDVPLYAAGCAIRGLDPVLLHEVPALEFSLSLTLAILLATRRLGGWRGGLAVVATFILMGLPTRREAGESLIGGFHAATIIPVFLAYIAIDRRKSDTSELPLWRLALFALALAAGVITDTMVVFMAVLPAVVVSGWRVISKRESRRNDIAVAIAAVVALVIGKVFLAAILRMGGFRFSPDSSISTLSFISFANLPQNISWTIEGLLTVCGADFFGQVLNAGTVFVILSATTLIFILGSMVITLRKMLHKDLSIDRISEILAVAMLVMLTAYVVSTQPVGLGTIRYFVPILFMGAVLAARMIAALPPRQYVIYAALGIAGLTGVMHLARQMKLPPAEEKARILGEWLQAHHLERGYGEYWAGAETTTYSHGHARVLPIHQVGDKVAPFVWGVDSSWYQEPMNFVVTIDKIPGDANTGNIETSAVLNTFGTDAEQFHVNGYTIFVYPRNITSKMPPVSIDR